MQYQILDDAGQVVASGALPDKEFSSQRVGYFAQSNDTWVPIPDTDKEVKCHLQVTLTITGSEPGAKAGPLIRTRGTTGTSRGSLAARLGIPTKPPIPDTAVKLTPEQVTVRRAATRTADAATAAKRAK